jgi:hypothetical protein
MRIVNWCCFLITNFVHECGVICARVRCYLCTGAVLWCFLSWAFSVLCVSVLLDLFLVSLLDSYVYVYLQVMSRNGH